jgi:hypothetical protein
MTTIQSRVIHFFQADGALVCRWRLVPEDAEVLVPDLVCHTPLAVLLRCIRQMKTFFTRLEVKNHMEQGVDHVANVAEFREFIRHCRGHVAMEYMIVYGHVNGLFWIVRGVIFLPIDIGDGECPIEILAVKCHGIGRVE